MLLVRTDRFQYNNIVYNKQISNVFSSYNTNIPEYLHWNADAEWSLMKMPFVLTCIIISKLYTMQLLTLFSTNEVRIGLVRVNYTIVFKMVNLLTWVAICIFKKQLEETFPACVVFGGKKLLGPGVKASNSICYDVLDYIFFYYSTHLVL